MGSKNRVYQQSSVIPWIKLDEQLSIVLITSNSGHWIFPKGLVEPDMTPAESAAKEALEEAGILGHAEPVVLSSYQYQKWGGVCHVDVFPFEVSELLEEWDEQDWRERRIMPFTEAIRIAKPILQDVLEDFGQWMNQQTRSAS